MTIIRRRSVSGFINDAMAQSLCSRCDKEVPQPDLFSDEEAPGQGRYAVLGQVFGVSNIVGGLLCGGCAEEFSEWWRL